jgi:hypothetical protein
MGQSSHYAESGVKEVTGEWIQEQALLKRANRFERSKEGHVLRRPALMTRSHKKRMLVLYSSIEGLSIIIVPKLSRREVEPNPLVGWRAWLRDLNIGSIPITLLSIKTCHFCPPLPSVALTESYA